MGPPYQEEGMTARSQRAGGRGSGLPGHGRPPSEVVSGVLGRSRHSAGKWVGSQGSEPLAVHTLMQRGCSAEGVP